jgi:heat shock protein HslJ
MEELAEATYKGISDKPVRLTKGRFEGEPFYPGGASVPTVGLVEGFLLSGDLDGDGADEAAVLLWENSGGSGTRLYIAVVGRENGSPVNLATALVGDRVQTRKGHIEGNRIVLDVVQAGPDDAACCPGGKAVRTWSLKGDALAEGTPQVTGRLSLADLADVEWVLRKLSREEKAPAEPEITLLFKVDGISGFSGCNRYFGGVEAGDMPGDISVKGIGGTKMACPDLLMDLETRYLEALGGVMSFRFLGGHLALTTVRNDIYDTLIFSPR